MGSAEFISFFEFVTDFADAAGDLFAALSFFAGSLETVSGILPA
ncbi:hypothetical protein C8K36_101383 [Rhodococcus sp. OK519]|nr:hypothetical protein C8K36_101383 [Rhodococcus sp. OK519]